MDRAPHNRNVSPVLVRKLLCCALIFFFSS